MNKSSQRVLAELDDADNKQFLRMRQAEPQTLDETISDLPMVAEQALDFTPVVGDVKAMIEIPEYGSGCWTCWSKSSWYYAYHW